MEQAHASTLVQYDAAKLRISHYEKLVGLCAGTLALSFTAATAFHTQHAKDLAAFPDLLRAWRLLLGAIVMGVVSNWLSVTALANLGNAHGIQKLRGNFDMFLGSLGKQTSDYPASLQSSMERESAQASRREKSANVMIRLAGVFGLLAQIVTFFAFVLLYQFAKAVLLG